MGDILLSYPCFSYQITYTNGFMKLGDPYLTRKFDGEVGA
jgi:hypothetical protein